MFNLDDIEMEFDDKIFDLPSKKIKTDSGTSKNMGKISFGVENAMISQVSSQTCTQSSLSSPPNILRHINNDRNIQECKEYFQQTTKPITTSSSRLRYQESAPSQSYSPTTSTQKPNNNVNDIMDCLFDKTNALSPIRIKPGISLKFPSASSKETGPFPPKIRKFPGPAGHLPNIGPNEDFSKVSLDIFDKRKSEDWTKENREASTIDYNALVPPNNFLDSDSWKRAKFNIGNECWPMFERYSLMNVLKMITDPKGLPNCKIPVTCLCLLELEYLPRDAAATMADDTGSIKAAIHRHVLHDHKDKIKVGSVFILQKVSVFSPSGKKYFLNITESNIVDILSVGEEHHSAQSQVAISRQFITALIDECNSRPEMDINENTAPPKPAQSEDGTADLFDDGFDDELAAIMDESFPN